MLRDQIIFFTVHTPGGLLVRMDLDTAPMPLQDIFRMVEDTEAMVSEKAVALLSQLTGCRCTITRNIQVTCDANYPIKDKSK